MPEVPITIVRRLPPAVVLVLAATVVGCGPARVAGPLPDAAAAAALRASLTSGESAGAAAEEVVSGTGWGSLTGRFVFVGTTGERRVLTVSKDIEVCSKDGMKLYDNSLRLDPASNGLADVVIFVRKSRRVKNPVSTEQLVFDQKNCEFLSPVFAARVGQPIDVRNSDPIGHNTNVSGSSFNQLIPAGDGTIFTPNRETGMPVSVTCNIHPWMKAYAVFRDDGYVAVSAADGSFTISDLPAGEPLEFQVWHARSLGPNGGLGLQKPELKWSSKGRFEITLEPDQVRDLGTLEVPAAALGG
ncbi:MAG: hypothetical protein O3A18_01130 [Planctomycetota bacterium]|nr:hypothetical protein [Planctomycetota bacterium]